MFHEPCETLPTYYILCQVTAKYERKVLGHFDSKSGAEKDLDTAGDLWYSNDTAKRQSTPAAVLSLYLQEAT